MNLKPKMNGILLCKQIGTTTKGLRLAMRKPKHNDEKVLTESEIDDYIARLKEKYPNDPKVAKVLLKWLELKQRVKENNFLFGAS